MIMYELHGYAMLHRGDNAFLVKNKDLTPVTPNDPMLTSDPIT